MYIYKYTLRIYSILVRVPIIQLLCAAETDETI